MQIHRKILITRCNIEELNSCKYIEFNRPLQTNIQYSTKKHSTLTNPQSKLDETYQTSNHNLHIKQKKQAKQKQKDRFPTNPITHSIYPKVVHSLF